uniref:Uncharacterized protein n=1 Tax=Chromera velia CCMP2878 TaxID=1169474 RepID=A0A0G4H3G7_9ALVE|eukprot:Cvel_5639.t1-p1 / transcript=Cvel_5639.t1 / gene=Cvel_5639 / organism=Chromera_velia_CCMP2878 / gene_product=hypothetical protein / transcript_product=hypothetical protein / location=Cvel_scaffold266:7464-8963(+) / protein_length=211 / sequence_SO=supercontig / SO=protein_coding / is_pseudo=false
MQPECLTVYRRVECSWLPAAETHSLSPFPPDPSALQASNGLPLGCEVIHTQGSTNSRRSILVLSPDSSQPDASSLSTPAPHRGGGVWGAASCGISPPDTQEMREGFSQMGVVGAFQIDSQDDVEFVDVAETPARERDLSGEGDRPQGGGFQEKEQETRKGPPPQVQIVLHVIRAGLQGGAHFPLLNVSVAATQCDEVRSAASSAVDRLQTC